MTLGSALALRATATDNVCCAHGRDEAVPLHHVNFHTLDSKPIFENDVYHEAIRRLIRDVLRTRKVLCLAWEVMPTHVHMIVEDFVDMPLPIVIKTVKGVTAHDFLAIFPELRGDLLGGHLWTKGYYAVGIVTYKQFLATLDYARTNRSNASLPPPAPLKPH